MKRFVLLAVLLLTIGVVSVNAEFDEDKAGDWLNANKGCSRGSTPIEDIVLSTIALNSDECLDQLRVNRMDSSGCFPKGNCNTKETALGALVLYANGLSIEKQLEYLEERLKGAGGLEKPQWMIQIVTNVGGECIITYEGSGEDGYEITFDENGEMALPGEGSWIAFDKLTGFDFNEAIEEINVDCSEFNVQKISIIKRVGDTFEIIVESNSNDVEFEIENGCYAASDSPTAGCDPVATFYASWVLNELGRDLVTENYLKSNANTDLYSAMLAKIDNSYLSSLANKQKTGANKGSFGSNVHTTSFAVYALKDDLTTYEDEISDALDWVESQQIDSGKIGGGVKDTASALYLIYGSVSYGGDNNDDDTGGGGDECLTYRNCGDGEDCIEGVCQIMVEECILSNDCPYGYYCNVGNECVIKNCESPLILDEAGHVCIEVSQGGQPTCNNDGYCDFEEDEYNCPGDCEADRRSQPICGNGVCDFEEDDFTCPNDCEAEKSGSLLWLWIIIIILVLGGIIFFVLTKLKKGGSGRGPPSYLQSPRAPTPRAPQYRAPLRRAPRDRTVESELDKSIKQAQDLLRKRK